MVVAAMMLLLHDVPQRSLVRAATVATQRRAFVSGPPRSVPQLYAATLA
jgi:hypothetical protein